MELEELIATRILQTKQLMEEEAGPEEGALQVFMQQMTKVILEILAAVDHGMAAAAEEAELTIRGLIAFPEDRALSGFYGEMTDHFPAQT